MADISRKHLIKDETTLMSLELTVIPCPLTLACQHKSSDLVYGTKVVKRECLFWRSVSQRQADIVNSQETVTRQLINQSIIYFVWQENTI